MLADLPASKRASQLNAIADQAVRDRVSALLAALDGSNVLFDRPGWSWVSVGNDDLFPNPQQTGQRVGAWRLTGIIGQGGMGIVYHAEREEGGFTQQAAVKMFDAARAPAELALALRTALAVLAGVYSDEHQPRQGGNPLSTAARSQATGPHRLRVARTRSQLTD
ncbi:MAG: hypothetical protein ABJB74_17525 [Gemmatimonas sp.]